jgi:hypothetical protein
MDRGAGWPTFALLPCSRVSSCEPGKQLSQGCFLIKLPHAPRSQNGQLMRSCAKPSLRFLVDKRAGERDKSLLCAPIIRGDPNQDTLQVADHFLPKRQNDMCRTRHTSLNRLSKQLDWVWWSFCSSCVSFQKLFHRLRYVLEDGHWPRALRQPKKRGVWVYGEPSIANRA